MRGIQRQSPIAQKRLLTLIATFVLIFTMVGMVEWPAAGLQAAQEGTPPTEILDLGEVSAEVEEPVAETPTEEPVPTEIVLVVPAPDGTLEPESPDDAEVFVPDLIGPTPTWIPEGSPGRVGITAFTCPAGYDTGGAGFTMLATDCLADTTLTDFTVANDTGFVVTQTASMTRPPFMQQTVFRDVPAGVISITETIPPGHGAPIVFCSVAAATVTDWTSMGVTDGGSVAWTLVSGTTVDCAFFNTLLETPVAVEDNTLTVVTFACPPGTSRDLGLPGLGTTCDPMPGISFAVMYPESGAYGTTDAAGRIDWTGIPAVTWSVFENIPAGYGDPVVFCGPLDETDPPLVPVVAGGFFGEFTGTGGQTLCEVFNIPVETGTGPVRMVKYTCPADVAAPEGVAAYTLSEQCLENVAPVAFLIVDGEGYVETVTATAAVPQSAESAAVPFGEIAITEAIPDGYGEPLVFCADTAADGPGAYVAQPVVYGDSVILEHRADAEIPLTCLFFNLQEDDSNTVMVDKYVCPPGVNAETDVLVDVCTMGGDGVEFEFVDGSGRRYATVTAGSVTWTDVVIGPVGELQIIETIPPGYGEPIVVCDGLRMDATGGFVVPMPGEARPFHVSCNWFNFVEDDSSLSLVKHECPAGYDPLAPGADPFVDCAVLRDGVTFALTGAGVDLMATTGDAGIGITQFSGLVPGDYLVTEMMPPGTEFAFVGDCFGLSTATVHPLPLAMGDTLALTLAAGDHVSCHWFNVKAAERASLVIHKYTCSTLIYLAEVDCQVEEDGATFDLLSPGGGVWVVVATMTTDAHGRATFGDLDPGDYQVAEHGDPWCHMLSDELGADGVLTLPAATATVVHVYNCDGTPGEPGELPTTYPNTGVPPAGGLPAIAS